MDTTAKRGALIVFEGLDKSGKTTQSQLLVEHLNQSGIPAKFMRFPNRISNTGKLINEYLTNSQTKTSERAIHLLFSANRWESRDDILAALASGVNVVIDRYAYSGVAYSVAKGLDLKWCKDSDAGLPQPDAIIFLTANPEEAKTRDQYGTERFETLEFQSKVKCVFDKNLVEETWKIVNSSGSIDSIHSEIKGLVSEILALPRADITAMNTLW